MSARVRLFRRITASLRCDWLQWIMYPKTPPNVLFDAYTGGQKTSLAGWAEGYQRSKEAHLATCQAIYAAC
jgi:hypothetical protein